MQFCLLHDIRAHRSRFQTNSPFISLATSASLSLIDKGQVQVKYKVSNLELQAAPASSQIPLGLQSSRIPCDHVRRTRSSGGQSFTHFRFRVSAMATFVCRVDALSRIRKLTSFFLRYSRVLTHKIAGARLSLVSLSLSSQVHLPWATRRLLKALRFAVLPRSLFSQGPRPCTLSHSLSYRSR